jgi:hypothetical protein
LGAELASVTGHTSTGVQNGGADDYEHFETRTYRFGAGVGTGTVREMGIGNAIAGNYLFSHHLLDTPIVKAAGNSLDVSYRFTIWPSLIETTATPISIGGEDYTCKTTFYNLAGTIGSPFTLYTPVSGAWPVFDGSPAGPLDANPSGNSANGASGGAATISNRQAGSIDFSFFYGLTFANTATDIITVTTFRTSNWFYIQTEFEALTGPGIGGGIPKDATKELTLNWRLTWGEKP